MNSDYAKFVSDRTKAFMSLKVDILHAAVGASTETGELLDIAKKMWVYNQTLATHNKEGVSHYDHLIEEAGDTLFYIQMLCNILGVTFAELIQANTEKLMKRYPIEYSDEAAAARADKTGAQI